MTELNASADLVVVGTTVSLGAGSNFNITKNSLTIAKPDFKLSNW
jgi:hypothetical protein